MPSLNKYGECIKLIRQKAQEGAYGGEGKSFNSEHAEDLIKRVEQRIKEHQAEREMGAEAATREKPKGFDEVHQIVKDEFNKDLAAAIKQKEEKFLQAKAWLPIESKYSKWTGRKSAFKSSDYRFAENLIQGTMDNVKGSRDNTWTRQRVLSESLKGQLMSDLKKAGVSDIFLKDKMVPDVMKETAEASKNLNGEANQIGVTGNDKAQLAGRVIAKHLYNIRDRFLAYGKSMGNVTDFHGSQSFFHDRVSVRQAGFEKWRDAISPALDFERGPFANRTPQERDAMLRESWKGLATGDHARETLYPETEGKNYKGVGGNVDTRINSQRVFHFNDTDKLYEYMKQFGKDKGSYSSSILDYVEKMAKQEVLLRDWGSKPRENWNRLMDLMGQNIKDRDVNEYNTFVGKRPHLDKMFQEISGDFQLKGMENIISVGKFNRQLSNAVHLGMSAVTSSSDMFTHMNERAYWGMNRGAAFADFWGKFAMNRAQNPGAISLLKSVLGIELDKAPQEFALQLGAGLEGIHTYQRSIFSEATEGLKDGSFSWMNKYINKLSGVNAWDNANNAGMHQSFGGFLARMSKSEKASPYLDRLLKISGVEHPEWEVLKKTYEKSENPMFKMLGFESRPFESVSPHRIQTLPEEDIVNFMKQRGDTGTNINERSIRNTRNELELKLATMFQDRVDFGLPKSTPADAAWYRWGEPGSFGGQVGAAVSQYKMFNMSFLRKTLGRDLYMQDGLNSPAWPLFWTGTTALVGWLMQSEVKNFLSGKKPADYSKAATWERAAVGSGAGFILGDYFVSPNSYADSFTGALQGPGFSTVNDAFALAKNVAHLGKSTGDGGDIGKSALRFAKDITPFANLPYTKALADYMVFYNLSELVQPGSLEKMEKRLQKNGTEFYAPPSKFISKPLADKERHPTFIFNNQDNSQ